MAKPIEDVTFEDVLRYKGSRWKKTMLDGGVDVDGFIEDLSVFLNDIPECRNMRAYVLMGEDPKKLVFDNDCDYIDLFYDFYTKNSSVIDSLTVGNGTMIPVTKPKTTITGIEVSSCNGTIESINESIDSNQTVIDEYHDKIVELNDRISSIADIIIEKEEKVDKLNDEIKQLKSNEELVKVEDVINSAYEAMSKYGFQPYYEKTDDSIIVIGLTVPPRFMYDINIPSRKPILTMPFTIKLGIDLSDLISKLGGASGFTADYPHPHVANGVCWGDLQLEAKSALKHHDFDTLFKLFDKLIRSYNSGSPYITWSTYTKKLNYSAWSKFKKDERLHLAYNFIYDIVFKNDRSNTPIDIPLENLIGDMMADSFKEKEDYNKLLSDAKEACNEANERR